MKKQLLLFLFAIVASVGTMFADETKIGDLYYNLNETDQTAEVTYELGGVNNYQGLTTANIPASVTYSGTTYSVTSIGQYAFNGCSGLTSVTIGNSVTSIGNGAFSGCSGLTSVTIPNSVTSIGGEAFYGCSGLTSVTLNSNAIVSQEYHSWGESNIENIFGSQVKEYIIGESVTSIGQYAFYGCSGLTSVTIGNSVTSIGNNAFSNCSSLTSVTIGNSVTSIGEGAFVWCSSLTKVNITDIAAWCNIAFTSSYSNPLSYAKHLFVNDVEVTDLVIPNSVTSIGQYAFYNCSGLTSVTIPNSVTSIGDWAFYECSGLTFVTIPNSVTSIGDWAFYECSGLTSVTIPNSVTSIGDWAFYECSGLTFVTIPNSVTSIGGWAFSWCSGLTSVTIPNSVTSIGYEAFSYCSSLTSVTIPNSVTSIEDYAFRGCSSLTSIEFPASLEYFDLGVINGCTGLLSIKIPSSVLSYGEYYGAECVNNGRNDCDEYYMCRTTIAGWVQRNYDSGLPYLPDDAKNSLPNLKIVEAPEWFFDVPEDGWAFCPKSLEKVIVNRGELNDNVFGVISRSYKTLKSLNVEAVSNTTLADEAFKDNYNLTELILPANLTSVSYMAVAGCKNLKAITIPASVEVIEASAFEDCRSIQSITFGGAAGAPGRAAAPAANSQLKKIGNWAFYNAHELQHLDIPEGVEEIGDGAFYGCTYLEDMVLPSSIRGIGDNCFALCSKLTKIVCNATTPPAIQAKTFYDVNRQIPVYVPDESVASYESDEYWKEFDILGASDIESAVSNMTNDPVAVKKVMRDGQVLILRDGKMYNLQGVEVK